MSIISIHRITHLCVACCALVLAMLVSSSGLCAEREIQWTNDYEAAVQRCATNNSILMLHFYTDNCPPCKLLEKKTFHDPSLVAAMNEHIVAVKINADHRRDLVTKYNVTRWPTDVYFFPNGEEMYRGVSDQDPTVYTQKIKRLALRNRDWTVERLASAKALQQRQDHTLATHPQPIQSERPVYAGTAGHPVKSQAAVWTNRQDAATAPSANVGAPQRVINNPYIAKQEVAVPAAPIISPNPQSNAIPVLPRAENHATAQPSLPALPSTQLVHAHPASAPRNNSQVQAYAPHFQEPAPNLPESPEPQQPETSAPLEQKVFADTVGLSGYCPVTLIESLTKSNGADGWVRGSPAYAVRHRGRVYHCVSEQARQTLLGNPDRYTPCLSGFDLVHFCKTGRLIDGKCEFGQIQSQTDRIFLFDNAANRDEFRRDSEKYSRLLENVATERVASGSNETQIR